MPPKGKGKGKTEAVGSKRQVVTINEIRENQLVVVPEDAQEGFQERIETGIHWTLIELAARHHREMCSREEIPEVTFNKAFQCCIRKSILKYFFHKKTGLSYDEQYCFNLPITVWDVLKFGTEEQIFLFNCANSLTDDLFKIIKKVAPLHSIKVLEKELKTVHILRVLDCEMTHFDTNLLEFNNLKFLNLCGNYLKGVDPKCLPFGLEALELQANGISQIGDFAKSLPPCLAYLGLSRNLLTNEGLHGISHLSHNIGVIDLSDNDILELDRLLHGLQRLPLCSLTLAGNPCAMCIGYVNEVKKTLPTLKYLDGNEIERPETDNVQDATFRTETDLLYTFFQFSVLRIMTIPVPPKTGPKEIAAFHVEVELPLLDKVRRNFLMFGANESLSISLPPPEVEELSLEEQEMTMMSKSMVIEEHEPIFNIYDYLAPVNLRKIRNYTIFESNKNNKWDSIMYFQEPAVKILCPDLKAIRDTFRTKVTVRLVYSVIYPPPHHTTHGNKNQSKNKVVLSPTEKQLEGEYRVTLATITCDLRRVDWKYPMQEFAWNEAMPTNEAQFQEGNGLSTYQYAQPSSKATKGKESDYGRRSLVKEVPGYMTIHVAFGISPFLP